jgi:hypothetical protein
MFDVQAAMAETIAKHNAQFPDEAHRPTGPRTEAGKQRTRLNAYKHGLTGQIHLFTAGEHAAFEKHCQSIVQALAPVGILEQQLAQSIAEDHWRLNRARALESGIFALGQLVELDEPLNQSLAQAKTWLEESRNIQLLSLYQQRIERSIARNTVELRAMRAERLAARQQALEEAVLLAQLAKSKGETYNPAADFPSPEFVFSNSEIDQLIARKQRLDEARALCATGLPPCRPNRALPKTQTNPNLGVQMPAAA